jgi:hypothetical protein
VTTVFGDNGSNRREFEDLMDQRIRIIAGQRCLAVGAGIGPQFDNLIGWERGSCAFGVSGLSAFVSSRGGSWWRRLDVRTVGGWWLGRVTGSSHMNDPV